MVCVIGNECVVFKGLFISFNYIKVNLLRFKKEK